TLHVSALMRMVDTGRLGTVPPDRLADRVASLDQQARRLTKLVDELLDVSRMTAGRLELERGPMDLAAVVREGGMRLTPEAARVGATLRINAGHSIVGPWDRSRLDQVMTNLVANAIKYAPRGPISIDVDRRDGFAVVTVHDRGPGIPEADQKRIFVQF